MRYRLGFLLATIFVFFVPSALAHASYTVAPLIVDHKVEARGMETDQIVITNVGPDVVQLFPAVHNVKIGLAGGIESFLPPSMSDRTATLSSWLEISRRPFTLKSGESATTTLTLRVNPNAEAGTYHALISFPNGSNRDEAEAHIIGGGVPATLVAVTVEKKTVEQLGLGNFHVDRMIWSNDNTAVSYKVSNTGDAEMHPIGDIIVYNNSGEEVASLPVNPEGAILKQGESVTFTSKLSIDGLMGKYKAYLSIHYGEGNHAQLQDTAYFYAVPWKKLLVLFSGLLLVGIALSLLIHARYLKKEKDIDDTSEYLPLHVRDGLSDAAHHDIDMKPRI